MWPLILPPDTAPERLGVSITHDIIVKQHSGSIEVYTQAGEFTEIRIPLPRRAAPAAEGRG
jgi:signal transduction histidine kinase